MFGCRHWAIWKMCLLGYLKALSFTVMVTVFSRQPCIAGVLDQQVSSAVCWWSAVIRSSVRLRWSAVPSGWDDLPGCLCSLFLENPAFKITQSNIFPVTHSTISLPSKWYQFVLYSIEVVAMVTCHFKKGFKGIHLTHTSVKSVIHVWRHKHTTLELLQEEQESETSLCSAASSKSAWTTGDPGLIN